MTEGERATLAIVGKLILGFLSVSVILKRLLINEGNVDRLF